MTSFYLSMAAASVVYEHVRQYVGVAVVKAQADVLLGRVVFCGPNGAEAYAHRNLKRQRDRQGMSAAEARWEETLCRRGGKGLQLRGTGG